MKRLATLAALTLTIVTGAGAQNDSLSVDTTDIWKDTNLGEVVVKGTLPKTRLKGDAQVTRITGTVLEKAGSSIDVMKRLPMVETSADGVSVTGRGNAEIYINGRRVDDKKELQRLPSDRIARVEVVQNPGARYAASTHAVIRIYLKKAQGEGFSLDNETHYGHMYGNDFWENLAMNYRTGGLDFGVTLWGEQAYSGKRSSDFQYTHLDDLWFQSLVVRMKNRTRHFAPTFTFNWQLDENHFLGMRYSYYRKPKIKSMGSYIKADVFRSGTLIEHSYTDELNEADNWNHSLNLYYSGKVNDWQLDVNSDIYLSGEHSLNNACETVDDVATNTRTVASVVGDAHNRNNLYAIKAVASHPLWGGQFAFGTEDSYTHRTTSYVNPQHIVKDDDNEINEKMLAAFVDYNHTIGKAYLAVGLRFEHTDNDYYVYGKRQDAQSKNYNDWFPSVSLSSTLCKIGGAPVQGSLSYSRNITRPAYNMLSTTVFYDNKYTLEGGNPLLDPTYEDNVSVNAAWKWLNISAGFTHIRNQATLYSETYVDANGVEHPEVSYMHPVELNPYNKWYVAVNASPHYGRLANGTPIWTPRFYANLLGQHYWADTPEGKDLFDRPVLVGGVNNHIALAHNWHFDVDYSLMSHGHFGNVYMKGAKQSFNFAIMKQWMKGKIETRLFIEDPFLQSIQHACVYNGRRVLEDRMLNPRSFSFSFRYKFNTAGSKYKGQGAGSSQKNRM